MTSGYFIAPDASLIPIREHILAVTDDPAAYGLRAGNKDVAAAKRNDSDARERVLTQVMRNGFIRIRGHRSYTTFEGWDLGAGGRDRIRAAIAQLKLHAEDRILVSDLASGERYDGESAKYGESEPRRTTGWSIYNRSDFIGGLFGFLRGRFGRGGA